MEAEALILALFLAAGVWIIVSRLFKADSSYMAHPPAGAAGELERVKVQYIIDGDTVIVSASEGQTRIRLSSIDCPEDGQPWGNIATAGLIKLIGGRSVYIERHDTDQYGRTVATIYVRHSKRSEWINVKQPVNKRSCKR